MMKKLLRGLFFLLILTPFVAGAAISVVRTAQFSGPPFGGGTQAASFGTLPAAGHAVIVKIGIPAGSGAITSVGDNQSGNTYTLVTGLNNTTSAGDFIYWCPSIGSATGTFTVTVVSTGVPEFAIMEVSGLSGAVDVSNDGNNAAATSATVTNGSGNTTANDLVITGVSLGTSIGAIASGLTTPPGNNGVSGAFTSLYFWDGTSSGYSGNGTSAGYKIVSSTETSTATWAWTASSPNVTTVATFKGSGGGGAVQSKLPLLGIGASLLSTPMYHDIDPIDCRRWPAANENIYQAAA